jgi:hypothetical protein
MNLVLDWMGASPLIYHGFVTSLAWLHRVLCVMWCSMLMLLNLACKCLLFTNCDSMTHFFGFVGNLILSTYGRVIEREVLSGSYASGERSWAHAGVNDGWRPVPPPRFAPSCSSLPATWTKELRGMWATLPGHSWRPIAWLLLHVFFEAVLP